MILSRESPSIPTTHVFVHSEMRLIAFCLIAVAAGIAPAAEIDFNRDIRPILSDNCFTCHGPSESTRKADLRLDQREDAVDTAAISPGDPDASEIIARIETEDVDSLMPPPDSNKRLTTAERELLRQWVAEGAEYEKHWSFVPPRKTEGVQGHPVDHFIEQRLQTEQLSFSPPADPRTLIRRATLDLTGMNPTLDEVEQFLTDIDQRGLDLAYEAVVDRLLASKAYGERMTLAWMDAARYGDTSVMHADGPRDMWPWRDWVIRAYNNNMPFDQFTVEQLAGDLLPEADTDQKVASGFNRNHATSDEGGAFPEELRVEYVVDRVQTTSKVWLALTMECAQCHDHKYDPISQEEYYRFFAYFNNTADPGMQTRNGNQAPVVEVADEIRERRLADLDAQIQAKRDELSQHREGAQTEFAAWLAKESALAREDDSVGKQLPGLAHWFPLETMKDNRLTNAAAGTLATLERGKLETAEREGSRALKLNGQTQFACSENAPALKHDQPFSFAAWVKFDGSSGGAVFSRMDVDNAYRGYDMWIQGKNIGTHIINKWSDNAIKVISKDTLATNQWQHVVISYDGSLKASGVKIYIDGKLSEATVEADSLSETIETNVPFKIGSRSSGANWKGEVDDIRIYDRALSAEEVPLARDNVIGSLLAMADDERSELQTETLKNHYFANFNKRYQGLQRSLDKLAKQHADLNTKKTTSMIMTDNPPDKMRMTYILDRGQYDSPKKDKAIAPGVPASLPAMPDTFPQNRLGLAQWLTQPDHPLTARVAVNRYWMMLFGTGLVRSASDFGAQGSPPSHPKLLDWLAVDFVESGWDVKRIIRQLVTSRTYRQSSRYEPIHLQKDPQNVLLARSPRFRMQGEFIRDAALIAGNLMVDKVGGPGVKPYQPVNIWNEVSLNGGLRYKQDGGEKLYRKSMYTYWKRSAPMPNMMIFDAPSREKCVIQRARTNTPLQALVTLNDPQFVEASRAFAQRLLHEANDTPSRIDLAYQLVTARPAKQREIEILGKTLADQRKRFQSEPEQAKAFLEVGQSPRDESIDVAEHAAWTVVAQLILNLDEALTRG